MYSGVFGERTFRPRVEEHSVATMEPCSSQPRLRLAPLVLGLAISACGLLDNASTDVSRLYYISHYDPMAVDKLIASDSRYTRPAVKKCLNDPEASPHFIASNTSWKNEFS